MSAPIVRTRYGALKGAVVQNVEGGQYLAFNGIRRIIEIQTQKRVPIYFYRFSASVEKPLVRNMLKIDAEGTCHGDELGCIFYDSVSNFKLEPDSKDRVTMERFTKMWTNFAKTGDPTPQVDNVITKKWLPVTKQEVNFKVKE